MTEQSKDKDKKKIKIKKLSEKQWAIIKKKIDNGEKMADVARQYGIARQTIFSKFSGQREKAKNLAKQIVATEIEVRGADVSVKLDAFRIADAELSMLSDLSAGASFGASTYRRLLSAASRISQKSENQELSDEDVLRIAQHSKAANEAAQGAFRIAEKRQAEQEKQKSGGIDMTEADYLRAIAEADARLGLQDGGKLKAQLAHRKFEREQKAVKKRGRPKK